MIAFFPLLFNLVKTRIHLLNKRAQYLLRLLVLAIDAMKDFLILLHNLGSAVLNLLLELLLIFTVKQAH